MSQSGGEKELIIGNKQLISLFFVVVALCGVFFAMGYMVRGNSLKGSVSTTTTDSNSAAPSDSVKRQQPEPPAETADASTPSTQPGDTPPAPVETRPAQDTAAQTLTADVKSAPPVPAKVEAPPPPLGAPLEPGTYVQVAALARGDADSTARTLREQHMPTFVVASPKEGSFRVMVGPYHLTSDVADAKAKLKTLGFSDTIVRKQQ